MAAPRLPLPSAAATVMVLAASLLLASGTQASPIIEAPALLAEPDVVYPRDAFLEGVAGLVTMSVELNARGEVLYVGVDESPDPRLSWAALGAVTHLPFSPAIAVDEAGAHTPIAVRFTYTLTFAVDEAERQHLLAHEAHEDHDGDHHGEDPIADGHLPAPATLTGTVRAAHHHGDGDGDGDPSGPNPREHPLPAGVADALVMVDGLDLETTTDTNGRFTLRGLPDGPVMLLIDKEGYAPGHVEFYDRQAGDLLDVVVYLEPSRPGDAHATVVGGRHLRREVFKRQLTQSVSVLDEAALARVRGRTLADTIREVPGVSMVQSGPATQKPVVRGQFGRRLLVLTDGIRLEGQDWGIDHAPEIDPQGAGEISVVKGAAGVRFGADAMGGVILVTPRPLRLAPGYDAEVSAIGVDNGYVGSLGGRVDVVIPELPAWSFRAEFNGSKGAARQAPDYVLGNTFSEVENAGAAAEWRTHLLDQPLTLSFSAKRHQANLGVCYCLEVNTPDDLKARADLAAPPGSEGWQVVYTPDRPRQAVVHDTLLSRARLDLGDAGDLTISYAFQHDVRQEFDTARRSVVGPQFSFDLTTHAVDATWEHQHLKVDRVKVTGLYGTHLDLQLHRFEGLQLIPNYQRSTAGLFGLETFRLDDIGGIFNLQVLLGGRVDGMAQTAFLADSAYEAQLRRGRLSANDCTVVAGTNGDVAHCPKNLPAASLTAGARLSADVFGVDDGVSVQVDISSATRFPDVDELYLGGRAPSFPVVGLGDGSLGPEQTTQLSVGGAFNLPAVILEVGAFASHVDNYIAFGPERGVDGRPIIDVLITGAYPRFSSRAVEALISGVDGSAVFFADQPVSILAQGALVRGLDLSSGGFLPFIPPNQARLSLRVRPPLPDVDGVPALADFPIGLQAPEFTTDILMVGQQERSDSGTDFAPPADAYALWNASAQVGLSLWAWPVDVGLEVRNILNTRYRDQLSLLRYFADQPGREVWLRLTTRFGS